MKLLKYSPKICLWSQILISGNLAAQNKNKVLNTNPNENANDAFLAGLANI